MPETRDPIRKYSQGQLATKEDIKLANVLHKYVDENVFPRRLDLFGGFHRDERLAKKTFEEVVKGLIKLDCARALLPKEYGGLGLESDVTYCIIAEELGRGDLGVAEHFAMIPWAFTPAIITNNKPTLERYAPMFCSDEIHYAAFEMTEPAGGCNIEDRTQHGRTIQTIAELKNHEWVINGQKIWAGNTGISEFYSTVCTTDPKKGDDGICIITIPKDTPGLSFGKPEEKMGMEYTAYNCAMYLDNVRVPEEYCTGAPGGEGAEVLRYMLAARHDDGAMAVGAAQACLEIVEDYTKDRFIVGKPVRERSLHAGLIGEMAMKIRAARSFYLHVASMFDHPELYGPTSSIELTGISASSKLFSTSTAIEIMLKCIELMGSYGYSIDYHIEKYLRDVIIVHLWMGGPHIPLLESAQVDYRFTPW